MGTYSCNPRTRQERRVNGNHEHRRVEIEVGGETCDVRIRIRGRRSLRCSPRLGTTSRGASSGVGRNIAGRNIRLSEDDTWWQAVNVS